MIVVALSGALSIAVPAEAAKKASKKTTNPKPKTITQYIDTDIFTGEIQQIDPQNSQITVVGKVVQRTEKIQVPATTNNPPPTGQPSATQTRKFTLAASFWVIAPNRPATLANYKVGDKVDVQFRPNGSASFTGVALIHPTPATPPKTATPEAGTTANDTTE